MDKNHPILVTGATGYVGGRLIPRLLGAGYRVRPMGRSGAILVHRDSLADLVFYCYVFSKLTTLFRGGEHDKQQNYCSEFHLYLALGSLLKILLPPSVQKFENILRSVGFGSKVDEFELSMNRAAEKAAPEAKALFVDAIKQMTFSDAKQILDGADDAATVYFKDKTSNNLQALFKPIIHKSMESVGVTRSYSALSEKIETLPFAGNAMVDLDSYVTGKSIDGLFVRLAEEEAKIRNDPAARVTDLLKKVFK